jgi:hypothetical protein
MFFVFHADQINRPQITAHSTTNSPSKHPHETDVFPKPHAKTPVKPKKNGCTGALDIFLEIGD